MDIRVKTFVAEACRRIGAGLEQLGFTGPEVDQERDTYPLVMVVRYHRADVSVVTQLLLAAGEEYVDTSLVWRAEDPSGGRPVRIGVDTAHTGYQMLRALDRHAQAIPTLLGQTNHNS